MSENEELTVLPAAPLIRRVPSQRYLTYLMVRGLTPDKVEDRCMELGLLYGDQAFLSRLHASLDFPKPFRPNTLEHAPSRAWLKEQGVEPLFPSPWPAEAEAAFRLIQKPRAREILEAMILSGAGRSTVARILAKAGIKTQESTLLWAERLFWDVESMDSTELRALVRSRVPTPSQFKESGHLAEAKKFALFRNPLLLLTEVPRCPASVALAQNLLGLPLEKVNLNALYDILQQVLATRALSYGCSEGKDSSFHLLNTITSIKGLLDIQEKIAKPVKEAEKSVANVTLAYRDRTLGVPPALTGQPMRASPYLRDTEDRKPAARAALATGERDPVQAAKENVLSGPLGGAGAGRGSCAGPADSVLPRAGSADPCLRGGLLAGPSLDLSAGRRCRCRRGVRPRSGPHDRAQADRSSLEEHAGAGVCLLVLRLPRGQREVPRHRDQGHLLPRSAGSGSGEGTRGAISRCVGWIVTLTLPSRSRL